MKRLVIILIIAIAAIVWGTIHAPQYVPDKLSCEVDGIKFLGKVEGEQLLIHQGENFEEVYIEGVNIGLGNPGNFPGEVSISKKDYKKWLKQISDLNVQFIRVYTLQSPVFYEALQEHNRSNKALYLIQGAYVNEDYLAQYGDMLSEVPLNDFNTEVKNVIDAVHGNLNLAAQKGHASGKYQTDVSQYVYAYLLGIEFDGEIITRTNSLHPDKTSYQGKYLETQSATPFEVMLAEVGDKAIQYENDTYQRQTIISFSNWPTSDPLDHPNEPEEFNNMIGFDVEHILSTNKYLCGMFASYHVYPYYPDFLIYEYRNDPNPYKSYLKKLVEHHSIPVVVAEFGIPTSRGVTHHDESRGYNQGGVTEKEQGEAIVQLFEDIKDSGCNGGIIFSWQDEWFKRTWNTMEMTSPLSRAYWYDVQTSETSFGLLAFDPMVDIYNETSIDNKEMTVYITHDAAHLQIKIKKDNLNLEKDKFQIGFDITPNTGITSNSKTKRNYEYPIDFILTIDGKNNSRIEVDTNYDVFEYLFKKQLNLQDNKEQNVFNPIQLRLRNRIYLPVDDVTIEPSYYETGKLRYGPVDYKDEGYETVNDFYQVGDTLEIVIPWELLNVSDPSQRMVLDDFRDKTLVAGESIELISVDNIKIGVAVNDGKMTFIDYTWDKWEIPETKQRLKDSYKIVQNYLEQSH